MKRHIEWQRVTTSLTTSVTTSDYEWQRAITIYKEWDNEWQRVTEGGTTNDNKWRRVTTNGNEWKQMTTCGTMNENEWHQVKQSNFRFQNVSKGQSGSWKTLLIFLCNIFSNIDKSSWWKFIFGKLMTHVLNIIFCVSLLLAPKA